MSLVSHRSSILTLVAGLVVVSGAAASSESELNQRWQGAWTVIGVETLSDCGGNYTNNEVRERRVRSKGDFRFAPGELGTVHKINLQRRRIEVLINLAEPLLVERREGPFRLYDALDCKVELQIQRPRGARTAAAELDELLANLLERHDDRESARSSSNWNGRLREPFPEDYEDTLVEYELWNVRRTNEQIAATIEHHVEEAARLVDRLDDDPAFLEGFAAGVDRARDHGLDRACERLLSMSASSFARSGSKDDERAYRDGYREGQELVFFLEVARRLQRCFLAPPP